VVQLQERMALYTRMRELHQWVTYRVTVRNWLSKYQCDQQLAPASRTDGAGSPLAGSPTAVARRYRPVLEKISNARA
jgi:hypothetical protein